MNALLAEMARSLKELQLGMCDFVVFIVMDIGELDMEGCKC